MSKERPNWKEYFMGMARLVATRSTCLRRQVGAVLVKSNTVISTGYNGAPKKTAHCDVMGCIRETLKVPSGERHELCIAVHAEQNVIAQAAANGMNTSGSTLFCTTYPCSICAKILVNAGICRIIYEGDYPDKKSETYLNNAGIQIIQYSSVKEKETA